MPVISAGGIDFNYVIDGPEGAPWITFSNSLATNITMWDGQAQTLSDRWQVLRYDQRGHGATSTPPPPYDFEALGGDVIAIWDALGIKRSVFCGLSMGGTTGLGIAINHADRLSAYVGCDLRYETSPDFAKAWDERIAMAQNKGMDGMAGPTASRWFTKSFVDNAANKPVMDKIRDMIATTSLDGFIGCSNALQNIHYSDRLKRINVPTLFIGGEFDPAANPDYMRPMQEAIAGAEMHVVPDAGHISNMENPASFNDGLTGFLNRL
jgi:3-oxoadipate enol-lactonase